MQNVAAAASAAHDPRVTVGRDDERPVALAVVEQGFGRGPFIQVAVLTDVSDVDVARGAGEASMQP